MKKIYSLLLGVAATALTCACTDDLDQKPHIGENSTTVYSSVEGYRSVLAKIYGSYTLTGQERSSGDDLSSNKGESLSRTIFLLQEGPTDECAFTWMSGDQLTNLAYMTWDDTDIWISDTYYRLYYTIALCNEFLRYANDGAIGGFSSDEQATIKSFAAEARFVRALTYWYVLDLYGQGPFVNEDTPTGGVIPEAYNGTQLYEYIKSEIDDFGPQLPPSASFGRADQAAAYALGARLALNGQVYTGTAHFDECISYCQKVLASSHALEGDYAKLFNADNELRTNEILFGFAADHADGVTFGGATNVVCGSCGNNSTQDPSKYGLAFGWGNYRVRGELPELFIKLNAWDTDSRCKFWTDSQTQYFTGALDNDTQGYWNEKWTNLTDAGETSCDSNDGCDTSWPEIRLAEVYLTAAEAVLRGGTGMSRDDARELVNLVRRRAYGDTSGDISDAQFNLDFIIDERGREFYFESKRRTDLVRYDYFTTNKYVWQWKGGVLDGRAVDSRYNIYPIPATEISANPNLSNALYK